MHAVVVRDLIVMARRPLTMVVITYVALLAGFVFAWEDGVPVPYGSNLYEQARLVQWGLLAVGLTWTAARCPAVDRGDDFVMTSALLALRPSSMIAGKAIALFAALTLVAATGLPVVLIAQQIAAVPASRVLGDQASLLGLTLLVSAVTLGWMVVGKGRLGPWLGASGSVGFVLVLLPRFRPAGLDVGAAAALVGLMLLAGLARWSDSSLCYLSDRAA